MPCRLDILASFIRSWDQAEQPIGDHRWRRRRVDGDRAAPEHPRLEHCPAVADLLPARLAAAWRMERVVSVQPRLLRGRVTAPAEVPVSTLEVITVGVMEPGFLGEARELVRVIVLSHGVTGN